MGNVSSKPEYNGDAFVEDGVYAPSYEEGSESYLEIIEGGFISPLNKPTSSFSLDSSSYAYSNLRRLIMNNNIISKDAVNIEQMLNYFNYSYKNDFIISKINKLEAYMIWILLLVIACIIFTYFVGFVLPKLLFRMKLLKKILHQSQMHNHILSSFSYIHLLI